MYRITMLLITAVTMLAGCSRSGIQGNGSIRAEDRSIADISTLSVSGGYKIQWSPGKPALNISTDENLLPLIETVVSGSTLKIDSKRNLAPTKGITIILSSASLNDLRLTGGNYFKGSQITGQNLKLESTGASHISVEGSVTNLQASLTGASKLDAKSLQTKAVAITLVGASDADVTASDTLKVSITGAGSLTYSGNPKSVEKNVTGAGSIRQTQ